MACNMENLSNFCTLLTEANLLSFLNEHAWTLFAPTNDAFANLGDTFANALLDFSLLEDILLYHVVDEVYFLKDFECNKKMRMANGKSTRTLCVGESIFQIGKGNNEWDALPQLVSADGEACRGVLHVINQVILPELY